jgi:hypothetical protein
MGHVMTRALIGAALAHGRQHAGRQGREGAIARREGRHQSTQIGTIAIEPDTVDHRCHVLLGKAQGGATLTLFRAIFSNSDEPVELFGH